MSSVALTGDGQRGWAVGNGGTIVSTVDGGQTWTQQASGTVALLLSVALSSDGQQGWAVGEGGTIVATVDGGKTWTQQTSGTKAVLRSVALTGDGERGWAVGDRGTIVTTADGGQTWTRQTSGTKARLSSVALAGDGRRGWAVGADGTILATIDGGEKWTLQTSGTKDSLNSVALARDGQQAWAVGPGGTILATVDGGRSWKSQTSGTEAGLLSVALTGDGQRGWVVGIDGTIVATVNGGKSWRPQASATDVWLRSVALTNAGQRGWIVGEGGTILTTVDGGESWRHVDYRRDPAPWFWVALPFGFVFILLAFRAGPQTAARDSIAGIATTDAPVTGPTADRLQFGPLARGISRFLRNENTEPPLTLAITGDWGTGKSSLMQLVCADLRAHGSEPVWFNAWHHQKEEHLLAALLETVRKNALPSSLGPMGWLFRLRLLWIRSKKHFALTFFLLSAAAALVAYLVHHPSTEWNKLWAWIMANTQSLDALVSLISGKASSLPKDVSVPRVIAQVATGLATVMALYRALRAFGGDPAVLFASMAERFRLKDASAQNSFRIRFAEQFSEVTEALPYRMPIVIDDLDRCKPDSVLEVMEAVNFLTTSGRCFVIFGMAVERVQAALALAFEKIAKEMVDLETEAATAADQERIEREKRRAYSRDYLEKLVNIEIKVPRREDIGVHTLLAQARTDGRSRLARAVTAALKPWPLYGGAVVIVIGALVGLSLSPPAATRAPEPSMQPPAATASAPPRLGDAAQPPHLDIHRRSGTGEVIAGDTRSISWGYLLPGLGILLLGVGIGGFYRFRDNWLAVRDSEEFERAFEIWGPVVAARSSTPRAIRRFGNRIRYLAMLQQGEALDRPAWSEALAQLRRWLPWRHESVPSLSPLSSPAVAENRLIALGAIFEVSGPNWRKVASERPAIVSLSGYQPELFVSTDEPGRERACEAARRALALQVSSFGHTWPPSDEELNTFGRLLAGVRLPGDVEVLTPAPRSNAVSTDPA